MSAIKYKLEQLQDLILLGNADEMAQELIAMGVERTKAWLLVDDFLQSYGDLWRALVMGHRQCECGEATGVPCNWSGPADEMTTVEWMPEHLRYSHEACGNSGYWPHNGARRLQVERSCANQLVQEDPNWVTILGE